MNAVVSIVLLAAVLGVIVFLLSRRENGRRSQYGPAGLSEFRTDLALDECFDRLDEHNDSDVFVYDCRRERDGGFLLHLTLHQPTQQPSGRPLATRSRCSRRRCWTNSWPRSWTPTAPGDFCGQRGFSFAAEFVILNNGAGVLCGLVAQLVRAGGS